MKEKHQVPISKSQINDKHQIQNSKEIGHLVIGFWKLFGIWDLQFEI
jgi:hypothetical protein